MFEAGRGTWLQYIRGRNIYWGYGGDQLVPVHAHEATCSHIVSILGLSVAPGRPAMGAVTLQWAGGREKEVGGVTAKVQSARPACSLA